jgi:hypothetical protein
MKTIFFIPILFFQLCRSVCAQELVIDPATSAAIAVNASVINGQLKTTNNNLGLIGKGQLAMASQLLIVNDLQNKIYQGLSQVASVISSLSAIKEIGQIGSDIVTDVRKSVAMARSDPALLLFARQGATEFETRAVALAADVSAFVLAAGPKNLMDSGERGKLLNHIATQMRILRGIAYGMQRAMYWARMRGVFRSLNPWAGWVNRDDRIARDVIGNAKFLK